MIKPFFSLFTILLAGSFSYAQNQQSSRPNIVFILADDLGYGDVGFNGQKLIKTPNIDRLAKEGMQFTQFYAGTTVCAPSRSALMTGQHTGHTYIRGNKEVQPEGQQPLADSITTIVDIVKKAGYTAAAFGKWGLGPVDSEGDPINQGFDRFYGYNCQALAHRYYPDHLWDDQQKVEVSANQNLQKAEDFAPDLIQIQAMRFLEEQPADRPFFLYLPYTLPHAELMVPDDSLFQYYKGKFPEKPFVGNDYGPNAKTNGYASQAYPHAAFAAMVARLDVYVGQVMAKLKEKGFDENTLVIFTSDNGPHVEGGADPAFFNSGGGFRGVKRDLYEGGIRVPFVARWPGVVKAGTKSDFIGAFWDIMPTVAQLAGTQSPAHIDGLSIVPSLTGKGTQQQHPYLYWEFHEGGGRQAVRQGNWKAVRLQVATNPNGPVALYDLATDPAETRDVAAKHSAKAKELSRLMQEAHVPSPLFPMGSE